jgi:hypothetical protein
VAEIWPFSDHVAKNRKWPFHQQAIWKSKKLTYLIPCASIKKNKGTFFSQILKVEVKKVPLLF